MPAKRSIKTAPKARASRKTKATKPKATAKSSRPRTVTISVGDEIICSGTNRQRSYRPLSDSGGAPAREYVSGIVGSIRDIRTGETVKVAAGNMDQYVFEVLEAETFGPGLSSPANSDTPLARQRIKAQLEKLRQGKEMPSMAAGTLAEKGLAGLDGWRIVKVHSPEITLAGWDRAKPKPRRRKKR